MRSTLRTIGLVGVVAILGALVAPFDAAAQPSANATVRVVHGLRGVVADIYVDGELRLPTFQPERATEALDLAAGDHLVEVRTAGAAMTDTPIVTQTITLAAGSVSSVVAHLDTDDDAVLTVFPDDLSVVPAGQSRLVVRHTAATGPIDVLVDDAPTWSGVEPGAGQVQTIAPGPHRISFTPAGGGAVVGTPQQLTLTEGTAQFVYLIGSAADDTLGWAAVEVSELGTAPSRVQTGDGSVLGIDDGSDLALVFIGATVALVLVGLSVMSMRSVRLRG